MISQTLNERFQQFSTDFFHLLQQAQSENELEQVRIKYLGRHGLLPELVALLKDLSPDEKKIWGPQLNALKEKALVAFEEKRNALLQQKFDQILGKKRTFDVTAHTPALNGSLHPLTLIIEKLENIFISMGFEIAEGPEVDTEFYNFEALNIPADHPARDMQDTFWINDTHYLLRTHTSNVQIHTMSHNKPPFAIASLGRVFRHEATDATHDFMFMQCEGLVIDKNISMSHLIATIKMFMQALFQKKNLDIRIRPSYFPFVEPGIEFDISCIFCATGCSVCKKTRWIELGGAGLVHPAVLTACHINAQVYSGFAWGFGIERLAMLLFGINDVRLYRGNKIEFLKQF
ncbi:MAG: phenylalanine--tRNA ligase subunit alpha [Candidatus Babeliaceae bacterium]